MRTRTKFLFIILAVVSFTLLATCTSTSGTQAPVSNAITKAQLLERIASREYPPIYKDWDNFPDIKDTTRIQQLAKTTVSWESIQAKGDAATASKWGPMPIGLEWDKTNKEYPTLTLNFSNVDEAKKRCDAVHAINPSTMIGVEVRWDAIKDFELPPDHKWWKKDDKGNRIKYEQSTPPRYITNIYDPEYINWVGQRCKALLDTGVYDFILLDHMKYSLDHGDNPIPMLKGIRAAIGNDAILIGNTHFATDAYKPEFAEIAKYVDAFGEEDNVADPLKSMLWWENTGRTPPRFNCWEFVTNNKKDLQSMRYYTTLTMTNTDASVRFIDHGGGTAPSVWYDFWDVKIGRTKGQMALLSDCYSREYVNGTTVCNATADAKKITFKEQRKRASTGETGTEFTLASKDGDMFLYVK